MDPRIDLDRLDRYLADGCSPRERAEVDQWLAADSTRSVDAVWRESAYPPGLGDAAKAWERVARRTRSWAPTTAVRTTAVRIEAEARTATRARLGVAAAFACAAIAVIVWQAGVRTKPSSPASRLLVYTTQLGQRAAVALPDGSTASLNVASRLEVPADFGAGTRTVTLTGEALFTVSHRGATPFIVQSGPTTTRVLGTTFAVRRYQSDTATVVAVRDGRVAVQSHVLSANQQIEVFPSGVVRVRPADPARFDFISGTLALDWMPLRDAVAELRRWYDVEIDVADPALLSRPIKGIFAAGSPADLAELLSLSLHAHVRRVGRTLTIYPH